MNETLNKSEKNTGEITILKIAEKDGVDVLKATERILENDVVGTIASHIMESQFVAKKEGRIYNAQSFDREVRGLLFENIALEMLYDKGEPPNRNLSLLITDICKRPQVFLSYVKNQLNYEYDNEKIPSKKEIILSKLRELDKTKQYLPKHPFNNDAIAFKTSQSQEGVQVIVTGSYEMKNYKLNNEDKIENVEHQLEESKKDSVLILKEVIKYLPDYFKCYERVMNKKLNLPIVTNIVSDYDYTQTIVQPTLRFSSEKDRDRYNQDLLSICDDVIVLGITTDTIIHISSELNSLVRGRINQEIRKGTRK